MPDVPANAGLDGSDWFLGILLARQVREHIAQFQQKRGQSLMELDRVGDRLALRCRRKDHFCSPVASWAHAG